MTKKRRHLATIGPAPTVRREPRPTRGSPPGRKRGSAKTIEASGLNRVLSFIANRSNSLESDRLKVLLSCYAGLRVSEIAALRIEDVTDADGNIASHILVRGETAKGGRERRVPMHPEVRHAIKAFMAAFPGQEQFAISRRYRTIKIQSVNSLTVWFHWIYRMAGLEGCSSHSGRRTFVTELARIANSHGASLRDVQILVGHARLDTTERYIEPTENLYDLVNSLGSEPPIRGRQGRRS